MLDRLIIEATEYEFKVAVEKNKPKSWLKSVSAFANGIGGTLFFGVSDDRTITGLDDAQADAEAISRLIKDRITPLVQFVLTPFQENNKNLLALTITAGRNTPYYYKADGIMEAYVRVGNESMRAPDYILNELILKGTNQSFDALITDARKSDYSFTLLEATYLERTGLHFAPSDYISFGLTDERGYLTMAGKLMADQPIVYNSRIFAHAGMVWKKAPSSTTRWTTRNLKGISSIFCAAPAISFAIIPRYALKRKHVIVWTSQITLSALLPKRSLTR